MLINVYQANRENRAVRDAQLLFISSIENISSFLSVDSTEKPKILITCNVRKSFKDPEKRFILSATAFIVRKI